MENISAKKENATDVMSRDVSKEAVNTDARVHTRIGWLVIVLGVLGFLLWAFFAPLDKGVPVSGTVTVSGNRKAIQHLTGGTVDQIFVKEGDVVKAGQELIKMNDVQAKSLAEITRIQYYSVLAAKARLIAERDGLKSIPFPPELEKVRNDPKVANNLTSQSQLFSSRRSVVQSELGAFDDTIAGVKSQIQGLTESRDSKKVQLQLLKEQLDGMRDLVKDGYVARNRLLELERIYAQTSGSISEDMGNIGRAQSQLLELNLRKIQRTQDYQKEVRAQLNDAEKESDALASRLTEQDHTLANSVLKAPVDGTVVGLTVFTPGAVVQPGSRLMDIVPNEEPLIVEGQMPVNLVDKVQAGMKVEMIFSAFNQNKTPHIPGLLTQVSADRLVDEKTGVPYYKVRAEVAPEGKKLAAKLAIRPGMPVEIFVKAGERSMMSYLLKPVFDRAKTSMSEE